MQRRIARPRSSRTHLPQSDPTGDVCCRPQVCPAEVSKASASYCHMQLCAGNPVVENADLDVEKPWANR